MMPESGKKLFVAALKLGVRASPKLGIRIGNRIRNSSKLGFLMDTSVLTRYFGVRMEVNARELQGYYIHVGRSLETPQLELLCTLVKDCKVFYDVGAHIGLYSLVAAHNNPNCEVYGFEPAPAVAAQFRRNLTLNPDIRNVHICPFALAGHEGFQPFFESLDGRNEGTGSLLRPASVTFCPTIVETVTGARFAQGMGHRPDLVKIDVEGAELEVLRGFEPLLESEDAPSLILEVHGSAFGEGQQQHNAMVIDTLKDMGYKIWRWRRRGFKPLEEGEDLGGRSLLFCYKNSEIEPILEQASHSMQNMRY